MDILFDDVGSVQDLLTLQVVGSIDIVDKPANTFFAASGAGQCLI